MFRSVALAVMLLAAGGVAMQAGPVKIPHGTVELVSRAASAQPGSNVQLGLLFRLEPGWHIYWKYGGDAGQPPHIVWQLPAGFTAGEIGWPSPKRIPVGPLLDYGYEGTVLLPVAVQVPNTVAPGRSQELKANLRVQICKDVCVPGKASLTLTLPVSAGAPAENKSAQQVFTAADAAQPQSLPRAWTVAASQTADLVALSVKGAPSNTVASFIPAVPQVIENAAPQHLSSAANGFELKLRKPENTTAAAPRNLEGLLLVEDNDRTVAYRLDAPLASVPSATSAKQKPVAGQNFPGSDQGLPAVLLLAFAGGLILNLMPCVFPVLSIKVLSLLDHSGGARKTIRTSAVLYTAGVLVSFWILVGILLGLRAAGRNFGWGFQLQSPGFVAFLICLLFVLGLSLLGTFEIGTSLMGVGSSLTQGGKYSNSFFTGVLATVVATPCTAPFMGAAVGFALSRGAAESVLVFTSLALGLASPFLVLSVAPALASFLPRPGAWMETLKQILAFPLFATVIWLLWVLGQQSGVNDVALLLFALLALSIAGWIAGRWAQSRVTVAAAALAGIGITAWISVAVASNRENPVHASTASEAGSALHWESFTPDKLAQYRAAGKPVLIDFTAAWCLTCQVNDRVVFHSPQVERHLKQSPLVLVKADWTSYDPTITDLLAKFGRSGIPFYVIYGADPNAAPVTLPDGVLTPSQFLNTLHQLNL